MIAARAGRARLASPLVRLYLISYHIRANGRMKGDRSEMHKSKKDVAYDYIKMQIVSGGLRPGQRVILAAIAHEVGMSTLPVREALHQLAHEGVVTLTPHVGAVVMIADLPRIVEVLETLAVLEGYATAQAKGAGELDALTDELDRIVDAMEANRRERDWEAFAAANKRFHHAIYAASPNETVRDTIGRLWDRLDALLGASSFSFMPNRTEGSIHDHRTIVAMLRDPATAPEALETFARHHKLTTARSLLEQDRQRRDDGVPVVEGMH
jgi:DNA-binding GntR family transcriptional regulator